MKKSFLLGLACFAFSAIAQAVDVECECTTGNCSNVKFSLDDSGRGTFLRVVFDSGNKTTEGYPAVTRDATTGKTVYLLNRFIIVEQDGAYTMPARDLSCAAVEN